ncbi:MAG: hypothetical protein IIX68_01880 [Clostridia bacterium]|nr:hypothetical protein [Clostridia bacterium]
MTVSFERLYADCRAYGWKVNEAAGTLDGLTASGVAFRALPTADTVKLAVRMTDKKAVKLQSLLTANPAFATLTVSATDNGIELHFPMNGIPAEALQDVITTAADRGVELASESFTDKLESSREPFAAYLRGFVGALLGALVGALPWFLMQWLAGWNMWYLAAAVSVAAFYGYAFLWGAHSTRFAMTSVVVCTLVATLGFTAAEFFLGGSYELLMQYFEVNQIAVTLPLFLKAMAQMLGSQLLWRLLACTLGLVSIRGRILAYTHEHLFLRGRR